MNTVISSLLGEGNSLLVFKMNDLLKKYYFISPEFFLIEIGKHTSEIAERSKLSIIEATKVMNFVSQQIQFVSASDFEDKFHDARKILEDHEKDVHYLALALKYNCDILSGDKTFKTLCPDKVKNTREILEELNSSP